MAGNASLNRAGPPLAGADELEEVLRCAAGLRLAPRATPRAGRPGPLALPLFTREATEENRGVRPYEPGDRPRLLRWKDLLARDELVVRDDQPTGPPEVQVLLSVSRDLLAGPDSGPFAVRLAFGLAVMASAVPLPTAVAFLGESGVQGSIFGPMQGLPAAAGLIGPFAGLRPPPRGADAAAPFVLPDPLSRTGGCRRIAVLPVPESPGAAAHLFRALRSGADLAVAFLPVGWDDLVAAPARFARDRRTGAVRRLPVGLRDGQALVRHLDAVVERGRPEGVRVEPLVVADPDRDLWTVLEALAAE